MMARYKSEHKVETHERIVEAAERCFKQSGYSGIGVDGLAKEAGVTSGAFYGHFKSKSNAFGAAVQTGMQDLLAGVKQFKATHGKKWWESFAEFYLGQKRTCDLAEGCALQTLTPEVGRAEKEIKAIYEAELLKVVDVATESEKQKKLDKTWVNLSMLAGGVTIARAVNDEKLAAEIATAIQKAISANNSG
jgi:AcrR family transcriptional regulator